MMDENGRKLTNKLLDEKHELGIHSITVYLTMIYAAIGGRVINRNRLNRFIELADEFNHELQIEYNGEYLTAVYTQPDVFQRKEEGR